MLLLKIIWIYSTLARISYMIYLADRHLLRYPFCLLLIFSLVSVFWMPLLKSTFISLSKTFLTRNLLMASSDAAQVTNMELSDPVMLFLYWEIFYSGLVLFSQVSNEPFSMAFVTAPNQSVAKTIASGLGKCRWTVLQKCYKIYVLVFY